MNQEHNKEQLEKLLHSMAQEAKPDKGFEKMLQHKLKMRFAAKYTEAKKQKDTSFWFRLLKFKLQAGTALILIFFTSTTIYAYNSDAVVNGHILYPLKRSVEKVEEFFVNSSEEKTDYYNRMAERRIDELDYLKEHGEFDEATIIEADELLSMAETEVINIPEENKVLSEPENNKEVSKTKKAVPAKEIAQQKVRQTHNELKTRFKAHLENNPDIGQELEYLKEKFEKEEKQEIKEIKSESEDQTIDSEESKPAESEGEDNDEESDPTESDAKEDQTIDSEESKPAESEGEDRRNYLIK